VIETSSEELKRIRAELEQRLRSSADLGGVIVGPVVPFGDGHSGFTYAMTLTGDSGIRDCVLRLSPPGARSAGPADIGRQGCLIAKLGAEGIPVPAVIAFDSERTLMGRSFMLVDRVEGLGWAAAARERTHPEIAGEAVRVLRRLHAVPVGGAAACLGQAVGPRDELDRWRGLLERAAAAPGSAMLLRALERTVPAATTPVVVHGDYHYGNLLFRDGEVVAVVDWELAGLGERLVDVGSLVVASLRRRFAPEPNSAGDVHVGAAAVVGSYGDDSDEISWFVALSCLKYAAIIGYNLRLHRSGRRIDPEYERLQGTIGGLLTAGADVLRDGLEAACLGTDVRAE
jgi:aminoglycoside phosphotransferase (APT) family kinase protein